MSSSRTRQSRWWLLAGLSLSGACVAALLWTKRWQDWSMQLGEYPLYFSAPEVVVLLGLLPLLLWGVGTSLSGLSLAQRLLSWLLRAAFLTALLLGMARPMHEKKSDRVCQTVLVDVSASISDADLQRVRERLTQLAANKKEGDVLSVVSFAQTPQRVALQWGPEGQLIVPSVSALRKSHSDAQRKVTDLQSAIEFAAALCQSDCENRYLIASDGIETRKSMLSEAGQLQQRGIAVSVLPLTGAQPKDVAVTALSVPEGVRVGEPFVVTVDLTTTYAGKGQLRLYQGELLNGLGGAIDVELEEGENSFRFDSVVRVAGEVSYRAEFVADGADQFEENNRFATAVDVPGPPRVLVVDQNPNQLAYFADALSAQQLDVALRAPAALPRSLSEINQFEFVVLSDVPQAAVPRAVQQIIIDYVRGGGGLLFAGGEAGYGPGGWQRAELAKILPVAMDARKEREIPGVAMALVIDRSGSMTGLPLAMAKEACIATLNVLDPNDLIEVIAFDSRPTSYVKMQPARYRSQIEAAVARIQPGGGTEIFNSLDMAYQSLAAVEARRKHIILLTDGNAGSDGIYELASTAFAEGITITSVGLGGGVNAALLSMIAETGGGRFHQAEDPSRLPRIFTRETELISKKASLDDWFPVSVARAAHFLSGVSVGSAPLLRGYTSTQMLGAPSELILASDRGEPILARRPVGLGWSVAWTSDLKARWAADWLRWRSFGKLFAQLIREHQKSDDTEVRAMRVQLSGEEVIASVEAFDAQENFDSSLVSTLSAQLFAQGESAEKAKSSELRAPFHLLAPGYYEARLQLPEPGSYSLKAVHQRVNKQGSATSAGVSFGSVSLPYPEEFRDLKPRVDMLQKLEAATQGAAYAEADKAWVSGGDTLVVKVARQNDFLLAAMVLFFLDLFVRRVRLFDRNFRQRVAASKLSS